MEHVMKKNRYMLLEAFLLIGLFVFPVSVFGACQYLDTPVIAGEINDPIAVSQVQYFLASEENLDVVVTGIYDAQTVRAVQEFQLRYAADILTPWGLTNPTGNVSVTTLHKINEIYCGEQPLSDTEIEGIQEVQKKYGVIPRDDATTSSSTLEIISNLTEGQNGRLGGTPIGFVDEFSLPILIMLVVLLTTQIYFMYGVAPRRRMQLIPREFK
jgi:hypothetical protein